MLIPQTPGCPSQLRQLQQDGVELRKSMIVIILASRLAILLKPGSIYIMYTVPNRTYLLLSFCFSYEVYF
jgi:hypothetical protein